MRDDFLTADWADHHSALSDGIGRGLAALRTRLGRAWRREAAGHQLLALAGALLLAGITLNGTAA